MVITWSPSAWPSNVTIFVSCGRSLLCSATLASCASSSANSTRQSESLRMYAVSSLLVLG